MVGGHLWAKAAIALTLLVDGEGVPAVGDEVLNDFAAQSHRCARGPVWCPDTVQTHWLALCV